MDQFSIHMHKNRMEAFQGMTPEEMEQAEACVQHFRQEHMGQKGPLRRNAWSKGGEAPKLHAEVEDNNEAWFDDVHNYGPI